MQLAKQCVWWEGAHQTKVVLKCTTVDSGVVCAIPHLHFNLMRLQLSADNWGTTSPQEEQQHTTDPVVLQSLSLAMVFKAVSVDVLSTLLSVLVPIGSI